MTEPRDITWTPEAVRGLGVRTDVPTAGAILAGLCRDEAYRMVQRDAFPVPVLKVGRRYVVPVAPILRLLGMDPEAGGAGDVRPDLSVVPDRSARPGDAA